MTPQPTATVKVTYDYKFTAERVFDAWLDPEKVRLWLFATPDGEVVHVEIDPRVGGAFTIVDRRNGEDVAHVGEYLELDRPKRIVFKFAVPKYTEIFTTVCVDIAPRDDGCRLTLVHEGVWLDYAERTESGWTGILKALHEAL